MRFVAGRGAAAELLQAGNRRHRGLPAGALQRRAIGKMLAGRGAVAEILLPGRAIGKKMLAGDAVAELLLAEDTVAELLLAGASWRSTIGKRLLQKRQLWLVRQIIHIFAVQGGQEHLRAER